MPGDLLLPIPHGDISPISIVHPTAKVLSLDKARPLLAPRHSLLPQDSHPRRPATLWHVHLKEAHALHGMARLAAQVVKGILRYRDVL